MYVFALRRTLIALPTLFLISILLFLIMHAMPGGPLSLYAHQPGITRQELHQIALQLGVYQPVWVQYWQWLIGAIHGDFGYSYTYGLPVLGLIGTRIGATALLMGTAFVVSTIVAIVLGCVAAVWHHTWVDRGIAMITYAGLGLPSFWLGLVLIELLSLDLHWLPVGGYGGPGIASHVSHLVLPVITLAALFMAQQSRYVRASMMTAWRSQYIVTARAKGVSMAALVLRHALRNALIPVVTVIALNAATLFGGAVITESIFSWPGMGRLFLGAVLQGDYPLMMAIVTLLSVVIVVMNVVADLLYAVIDPRVTYS
jgi:peptide/nickel transport system permease protein